MLNNIESDFLFEIGVEELPSGAVKLLGESLADYVAEGLNQAQITYKNIRYFASPRRIAVYATGVQSAQAPTQITKRGPAQANASDENGNPKPALIGFAKSCGVSVDELSLLNTDKGSWWVYTTETKSILTRDLLPKILSEAVRKLPIKKLMRWGNGDLEFVRPVHWVVLLWNNEVIELDLLGVKSGRNSYGHRFHHPQAVAILTPNQYEKTLQDAFVIADFALRRQMMVDDVTELAKKHGYTAVMPEDLIDEVTSIVEKPYALIVPFDPSFLVVPDEVLIMAMQVHQKCFALYGSDGKLQPYFITVANIHSKDPKHVILGHKQVMHARLSDAAFFYQQDKARPLSAYIPETKLVLFQAGLGSLEDQSIRLQHLLQALVKPLNLNRELATRAALLSQCDLLTGMVGEFPELQGVMGYYYALHDNENNDVAVALLEQYYPRFAADKLPQTPLGLALSLVTRVDLLVGAFLLGKKPSGVKDPFKLRRHALALVRLMLACNTSLCITDLFNLAIKTYADCANLNGDVGLELKNFVWDRLQSFYNSQGVANEVVQAVRVKADDCLVDVDKRIRALVEFQVCEAARLLSSVCKRVNHLLHAVANTEHMLIDVSLLQDPAESKLFECLQDIERNIVVHMDECNYAEILLLLASFYEPVDNFFANVLVNVEDVALKHNRLALLIRVQRSLQCVADLALL
jgi:glycyl-tRNA synthetase beta chain